MFNIDLILIHVSVVSNQLADLLSRWTVTCNPQSKLKQILPDFCWTDTHIDLRKLNHLFDSVLFFISRFTTSCSPVGHQCCPYAASGFSSCHPENIYKNVQGFLWLPGGHWAAFLSGKPCYFIGFYGVFTTKCYHSFQHCQLHGWTQGLLCVIRHKYGSISNHQLQYIHRAAKLQIQSFPKMKLNLDEFLLTRIITACDTLQFPFIFKPLYLLAFFSFLRISNILPHAITSFEPTHQLAVGDVIFSKKKCCHHYHQMVQKFAGQIKNTHHFSSLSKSFSPMSHSGPI